MTKGNQPPWAIGPGEILRHGLDLLKKDSDTNRRLAMISIDNAVELMLKTYLGLPKRITGLKISREDYQSFSESFPKLLDALEKHASDKLDGIDLGEIEWYHRLRNQLYHQGNGLTVDRDKVEVYAELANVLFTNLFGFRLVHPADDGTLLLGNFMLAWASFETAIGSVASTLKLARPDRLVLPMQVAPALEKEGFLSKAEVEEINRLRRVRNEVVHGIKSHSDVLNPEMVDRLKALTAELKRRLSASEGAN